MPEWSGLTRIGRDFLEEGKVYIEEPRECPKCKKTFIARYSISSCQDHKGEEALYPDKEDK